MKPKGSGSIIVAVSGGSGSGKTTFARALQEALGLSRTVILSQDAYYIDQSARFKEDGGDVNFDHPSAIDFDLIRDHLRELKAGRDVEVPIYDFATHQRRVQTTTLHSAPFVILDGTLVLAMSQVVPELNASVFIDLDEATRFARRLKRDTTERGRTADGVTRQFQRQVKPMHDQFVEPSKGKADWRILGTDDFAAQAREVADQILRQSNRPT